MSEEIIIEATKQYFAKKGFEAIESVSLKYQPDLILMKGEELIAAEIKAGAPWTNAVAQAARYKPYFNKTYVCFPKISAYGRAVFQNMGVGVLVFEDEQVREVVAPNLNPQRISLPLSEPYRKVRFSICLDEKLLEKITQRRGRLSRNAYIVQILEEHLK